MVFYKLLFKHNFLFHTVLYTPISELSLTFQQNFIMCFTFFSNEVNFFFKFMEANDLIGS